MDDIAAALTSLASWSPWVPFERALVDAPREPGVYLAREGAEGPIVYVGMAGERVGSGVLQGIRGRLRVYGSGKALTSGLGEAVADRALADASWLRERVAEAEAGAPLRARDWGKAAFKRANLYLCWTTTDDRASAKDLEVEVGRTLDDLWNRQGFAPRVGE